MKQKEAVPVGIRMLPRINESEISRNVQYKVFIGIFTFLIYTGYHMSRKPLSVVKNILHENCTMRPCGGNWAPFDQSDYQMLLGSLDYAFLFSYTVSIFFSGYIAERMNLRYFLSAGMILTGFATIAFGLGYFVRIHSFAYYIIIQILAGVLSSTGWPSVVECMSNWFGKGRRGLVMGVWNSHTSVGNILGSVIAGVWVEYKWGWSFVVPGVIIATLGILCFLFLVPNPSIVNLPSPEQNVNTEKTLETPLIADDEEMSTKRAIRIIDALRIPGVVEYSLALFFAKLVSYTFLFWLPQYIHLTAEYDPETAADISAFYDLGGIMGVILAGHILDVTGISAVTCSVMLAIAAPMMQLYRVYGSFSYPLTVVLLILCGSVVNGPYGLITTAISADLGNHPSLTSTKAVATVSAIIDGTGSLGAAVGPLLTGLIVASGWKYVFYMLTAAIIASILCQSRLLFREVTTLTGRQRKSDDLV